MTDRPIIFSAPMVRALIEGRKTQTRRVLKPQPQPLPEGMLCKWHIPGKHVGFNMTNEQMHRLGPQFAPFGPGDRLYVREAHKLIDQHCDYRADWPEANQRRFRWRPSIHMPRWASRLTLTVTDVRVQRLQDISEADAGAEGIRRANVIIDAHCHGGVHTEVSADRYWNGTEPDDFEGFEGGVIAFEALWGKIHGPAAWDANPWVCAISFNVRKGNIDAN